MQQNAEESPCGDCRHGRSVRNNYGLTLLSPAVIGCRRGYCKARRRRDNLCEMDRWMRERGPGVQKADIMTLLP
ncbi:hypothetical protein EmuJ_000088900 [Echinococcus multilocularis]|uniref:Uncharacterized protein n=1 Tax=Echinococcus multilocularis TaxID=6211 RepID=A0A087VY87_ECHMU|nr:hypothetical protein EmuJ_000088900 [Echinococcus multilocularis]